MRNIGDLQRMVQQAQEQMARIQAELAEARVEGSAGGGAVRAVVTGSQDLVSLEIDPGVVDSSDVEMLQDLVVAAIHDAVAKSRELAAEKLGPLAGAAAGLGF